VFPGKMAADTHAPDSTTAPLPGEKRMKLHVE
jgi:hypothetical protein